MGTYYDSALYDSGFLYDAVDQLGVRDLRVELFRSGRWRIHTSDVRTEQGIRLGRGRSSEDSEASASYCDLTFDNTSGNYSPRNTAGQYYGEVVRNTPLRVGFGKPVVASVSRGTGSPLTLASIADAATHSASGVMAVLFNVNETSFSIPSGYTNSVESDQAGAGAFSTQRSFLAAGSGSVPAQFPTSSGGSDSWITAHLAVPGGTFVVADGSTAAAGLSPSGADTSGLTEGDLVLIVCGWTSDPYGRMQPPVFQLGTKPVELYNVVLSRPGTGPRIAAWAYRHREGVRAVSFLGADDGATGAMFHIAVFSGAAEYSPRFCGEVANWPVSWDLSGRNRLARVRAAGAMRRMSQASDAISHLRTSLGTSGDISHYWPMEESGGATSFAPAVGGTTMQPVNGIDPGSVDAIAGAAASPSFTGRGARGAVIPANSAPWGFGGVVAIPPAGTAAGTNLLFGECAVGGDVSAFGVEYTNSTTLTVKALFTDGTTASASMGSLTATFPGGLAGRQIFLYVAAAQSGGNVAWSVAAINVTPSETLQQTTASGSISTKTLGPLAAVTACVEAGSSATIGTNGVSVGHVFVTSGSTLSGSLPRAAAARALAGYALAEAALTVTRDAGFPMAVLYPTAEGSMVAGPVEQAPPFVQLRDLAAAGQALHSDAAGFPGIEWRPVSAIVSADPVFVFDYDEDTFTDPFEPVDDDRLTVNDATVESTAGGEGRYVVEVGALGAQPGGVGRYPVSLRVPVENADAARDLAGWLTGQGTFDVARWPQVGLRMSGAGNASLPLSRFSIGDTVRLDNLPSFQGPASIDLVVVGFEEELDSALWTVTLVTRPAGPYRVLIWDDATFGVWADGSAPAATDNRWSL